MKLNILFIDNHLLVVEKPAGLLAQADETGDTDLLSAAKEFVKHRYNKPGNAFLGLVHRLDRPVSGLMVLARTSKAAGRLSQQFRNATPVKRYLALVEGRAPDRGTCKDYLVKQDRKVRIVDAGMPEARLAELRWQRLACAEGLSLLDVSLGTGRPHQIRVQLAARRLPILGDIKYGTGHRFDAHGLALHCYALGVQHPVTKERILWTLAPPKSWQGYFEEKIKRHLENLKREQF